MRSLVVGLVLGIALTAAVPAVAQSPSPNPCLAFPVSFAPGLLGATLEEATATAASGGYQVQSIEQEDPAAEAGTVIAQVPDPGAAADHAVPIVLTVAIAPTATPEPTKAPVDLTAIPFQRLKAKAVTPKYKTLFRNAENYNGRLVYGKGQVLQYVPPESVGGVATVLVNVTHNRRLDFWDDVVWLNYTGKRVIPEDIVEFVGMGRQPYTYESAGGGLLTVPMLDVVQLRRVK